jgi:PAS domain S-box-containing protein
MQFISQNKTKLFYVLAFIALVSILSVLFYNSLTIKATSNLVDHTKNVMHKSDIILVDILNIETGSRGYVLMGDTTFLEPYKAGLSKISKDLEALRRITDNNIRQQTRFDSLSKTIFQRIALSKAMVEAKRQNMLNGTLLNTNIEQGKVLTDSIRNLIVAINSEELLLLKDRKTAKENSFENSSILYLMGFILIVFIFVLVAIILKNQKSAKLEYEKLSSSQEQLSQYSLSLIEASLDPLITINIEGKITDMNQATATITGLDRTHLVGSDFFDYFTEPQKAREVYQEVFARGSVIDSPLTLRHTTGKLTDVLFNGSVYKDIQGNVLGVVVVARDIAEQKWARDLRSANSELAFQNQEKENRAAELLIANEELEFQNQEKENRAAELLIANEELAYQNKVKEKRAAELIVANKELLFQNSEKKDRADELVIADKELDFQNEEKEKRKVENTALEAYSSSLKLASQYSLSLIEASLDPLFVISPQGKITDTNQATARVTGVSKEQLIGSDFIDYFTEPQKAKEGYLEVFAKGHVSDYPLTITDGELVDVLFNGAVYTDEKNNVIGAVVVARDITKQKQTEKELIEAKIFAELATAIAEEAKINAENAADVAKDAVKSKQQFLSNMSHEIRTPMNAIIGFTKVVLKTNLTAKQKEYLTAIKMSGDALIVLINDILDLAKVNSGKMVFEKTPFKLSLSISAMLHLFETKIQEKNLKLITKYDDKIPEVLVGDAVRLHQIILNLVSNAVKFTSKGNITVSANLIEDHEDIVVVEFTITDTGIGINSEKMGTIFENFQQATSGTSRLYGGTGLGLAIVKQLVEAQEGSIRVESKIEHGSSFIFRLPFNKTNAEAVLVEEIVELDLEVKDIKILVVEDMELNQLLMKTLLDDFGFESDITANGKLAIEKLQDKSYDIILMDLQMPEMNGFEATEYIRKTMKLTVPIMALTADVTTVDLAKCKAVGMNDYVAKPIDERLLYSKIIGLVKKPILIIEEKTTEGIKTEKLKYVDLKYLNKLTKSNPKLMTEMIRVYLKQTPPLIEAMKQSLIDKDWATLKSAAHKIIPSFTIMGISPDFENMALKIQEYASNIESMGDINELILQLEVVCNSAYIELENELNAMKNPTI